MILLISNSTNERFRQNERGVAVDLSEEKFFFLAAGRRQPRNSANVYDKKWNFIFVNTTVVVFDKQAGFGVAIPLLHEMLKISCY